MQSVRSKNEYPSPADVVGTTRFDGNVMRPVVIKHGQIPQVVGQGNMTVRGTAGAYTVLPSDGIVVVTYSTAQTDVYTLPAANAVPKGHQIIFKKTVGTSVVRLTRAGSDTIDGGTTHDMTAAGRVVVLVSNGVDAWYILQTVTPAAA